MSAPRVEACIQEVMREHPGETPAALARYFEAVHQELAPLARELESQLAAQRAFAKAEIDSLRDQLREQRRRAVAADRRATWVLENSGRLVEIVRRWDPAQGTLIAYLEHCIRRELGEVKG
jgi:hypothetical protein